MGNLKERALEYHLNGKIEVVPTKGCQTASELSLAYTPGVAYPVLEIARDEELAYKYTAKGNLVAVISNGTAILGLGNQGALASKPVMEGKGVLFKRFADIDVFDIEVDATDVDKFVEIVKAISPTFGGINLEDIKSPECFEIERQLIEQCNIPIFHDDQHGTAIITTAALLNGCELTSREVKDLKVVIQGAGAAGLSSARMFLAVGVQKENLIIVDSSIRNFDALNDVPDASLKQTES
jgi:malate dehydrogenase (oxaloacetate-decarboxylating)(NADP+)